MKKSLPKIPSPPIHYWNFFRQHVLPVIVFILAVYAAVVLWKQHIGPANVIGEVEMTRANVTTVVNGIVKDINVDLLQRVEKDQPLCTVETFDPTTTKAMLDAIAADLETLRTRLLIDQRRNNTAYEQLRVELMLRKVDLESARVNLEYAKTEYERSLTLYQQNSDTEFHLNYWKNQRDLYESNVKELEILVKNLEQTVESLKPLNSSTVVEDSINKLVTETIAAKQRELEELQKPTVLKAPIDGFVSMIYHRNGEKVPAGTTIMTISGTNATRIIGFVRQPLNIRPKVGDQVEIRTRTHDRKIGLGTVTEVGAQLEPITPSLMPYITGAITIGRGPDGQNIIEYALPFLVSIPANMELTPGEVVVLNVIKKNN